MNVTLDKKVTQQSKPESVKKEVVKVAAKKLSFKETKELADLPGIIDTLENNIAELQEKVNQHDFFSKDEQYTKNILNELGENESKLDLVYTRWQELDEL